jgi:exopolyphosphatase/guanosine-5'-triphosphate,3'-diphosphate pyrophosphatase
MTEHYGVIDVGSNTIVLLIYEVDGPEIRKIHYECTAAHLVQYVRRKHMSTQGIETAVRTVKEYQTWCRLHNVQEVHVDITACGRNIDNQKELVSRISRTGVSSVTVLSGQEEAMCDFYGMSLDRPIQEGLLIDIGGGSTEFTAFRGSQIIEAVSIPLGCVRLADEPYTPDHSLQAIAAMRKEHPLLTDTENAIGVGGTIRACQAICRSVYGETSAFTSEELERMYKGLVEDEPKFLEAMRLSVSPERQPVFIPGMGMLTAAARSFHIHRFYNSENGVREGFLLKYVLHRV